MAIRKITDNIVRITEIMNRWENASEITDIERELVLDKLKQIYEDVMFFERDPFENEAPEAPEEPKTQKQEREDAPEQEREEDNGEIVFIDNAPEDGDGIEEGEVPEDGTPEDGALQQSRVREDGVATENPAEENLMEESAGEEMAASEQILFEKEALNTKPKIDRETIMSLYGNDPSLTHVKPKARQGSETQSGEEPQQVPKQMPPQTEEVPPHTSGSPEVQRHGESTMKKVLGEIISTGNGVAFNEAIGKNSGAQTDVASKIYRQTSGGLHQSIGLNDKFILIKDLFGGDPAAYEEAISSLEAFDDFDEAMIYIQETYTWNPDSDGVKILIDLLERKLA